VTIENLKVVYFLGIGGIGMSALARYLHHAGIRVHGYDKTPTPLTTLLESEGMVIHYEDQPELIPQDTDLVVYTPAIPSILNEYLHIVRLGVKMMKRSELLGEITSTKTTLAVAGTHGKTTVSTMLSHILYAGKEGCTSFLGGISKNYNSNLLLNPKSRFMVAEADEFDRSFLKLFPWLAVITSTDADHLDIYGDRATMVKAYNEFCGKIRKGGKLVVNAKILSEIIVPEGVTCYTYGSDDHSDYRSVNIKHGKEYYSFDIQTPSSRIDDLHFAFPGLINIENFTAAIAIALMCGVTENEIRKAVLLFQGVRRRFDIRINIPGLSYVDDYAHHPEEISACIKSMKEFFRGRKITGIFQPHLFSRTQDHAEGFAKILDELDEVILLPIYPAREKPIEGVTSELIFNKMKSERKRLLKKEDIPGKLDASQIDVLLTIGAGDIDSLVAPIEEKLKRERF
jgi:UDP-N-acetylmuramate--alanine ligase